MVPVAEGVDDIFLKVFSGGLKKYASHSLMRCPMSNGRLVVVVVGGSVDRRLVRDADDSRAAVSSGQSFSSITEAKGRPNDIPVNILGDASMEKVEGHRWNGRREHNAAIPSSYYSSKTARATVLGKGKLNEPPKARQGEAGVAYCLPQG